MGQQQLLLVILVTIIVGIATVVAINTFGSAADSANLDAVRQDMATIASSAQGYYMKPTTLGGGSNSFDNMDTGNLGAVPGEAIDVSTIRNENGTYDIGTPAGVSFTITATPASDTTQTIGAYVEADCINVGDLGGTAPTACN